MNQHLKSTILAAITFVAGSLADYLTSKQGETITVKGVAMAAGAALLVWFVNYNKTDKTVTTSETTDSKGNTDTTVKTVENTPIQ